MTTQHSLPIAAYGIVQLFRQHIAPLTFLRALLQNARRAQAKGVWFHWQEQQSNSLTVWDDGCGIPSFDRLTAVGKPSWDEQIVRDENPLGFGFLAVPFAANTISIRSKNWTVTFNSEQFLNHGTIHARDRDDIPPVSGTHITLYIKRQLLCDITQNSPAPAPINTTSAWRSVLEGLVTGFPVPVYFQNEPLPRPDALSGGGHFINSEVGLFRLSAGDNCTADTLSNVPVLYCQGLPLGPGSLIPSSKSTPDILHLPDRTPLTLPNRDQILDEDDLPARISRARRTRWRNWLIERAARLPIEQLALHHWELCLSLNLSDLLHQAPLIPSVISRYEHPLTRDPKGQPTAWTFPTLPTAKDIFIYEIDPLRFDDNEPVTLASLYAAAASLPVLKQAIPKCHWSHQRAVDLLDPELGLTYSVNGPTRSAYFAGHRVAAEVIICDSMTIRFDPTRACKTHPALSALLEPQTVTQWPLYDVESGRIIVPSHAEAGPAVRQIDDYQDSQTDFIFHELRQHDQSDLSELVEHLRNNSPMDYLNSLLSRLSPDPKFIGNATYCMQYDHETQQLVLRGQAVPSAPSSET